MTESIRLDLIDGNPWQPRKSVDQAGIAELALSIARDGLLQIPVARLADPTRADSRYQLALGHRRLEAFRLKYGSRAFEVMETLREMDKAAEQNWPNVLQPRLI